MQIEAFCIYGKRNVVAVSSAIKIREITSAAVARDGRGMGVSPDECPNQSGNTSYSAGNEVVPRVHRIKISQNCFII